MPFMNTFCTWLPLRLGSIVVGVISMVSFILRYITYIILCILLLAKRKYLKDLTAMFFISNFKPSKTVNNLHVL